MMNFKYKGPKVLLTEGKNDCHVVLALCKQHNVPESFGFYDCESDDRVLKKLSALIAGSENIETIGVVLDADNPNLLSKWNSLSVRLQKEGYVVPEFPLEHGTILAKHDKPTVGIWLMPDNHVDGMLEDFCHQLIDKPSLEYASQCVIDAKQNEFTNFLENHFSKAVIHTFLAWQDVPGMPLGQAITARALNGDQAIAVDFSNFLKRLF